MQIFSILLFPIRPRHSTCLLTGVFLTVWQVLSSYLSCPMELSPVSHSLGLFLFHSWLLAEYLVLWQSSPDRSFTSQLTSWHARASRCLHRFLTGNILSVSCRAQASCSLVPQSGLSWSRSHG